MRYLYARSGPALALFLLAVCPSLGTAQDGYVGIYADAAGNEPCTSIPAFTGKTLYVVAMLDGATAGGITGAEFRIEVSQPNAWWFNFFPAAGSTPIGSPLDLDPANSADGSGLNIAFPTCQVGTNGTAVLGTVIAFNAGGSPTTLSIKRHSSPSNALLSCPLFTLCDGPVFSARCMTPMIAASCSLGIVKAVAATANDQPVFVTGLNAPPPPTAPDPSAGNTVPPSVLGGTAFIVTPPGRDVSGPAPVPPSPSKVVADTTWIGDWGFGPFGSCSMSGWQKADNRDLNDGTVYWSSVSGYGIVDGTGTGVEGSAAVLRSSNACFRHSPGYGNNWDQSLIVHFSGTESTLDFDYIVDCEDTDGFTVEVDFGCDSGFAPNEWQSPESQRTRLPDDDTKYFGVVNHGHVTLTTCRDANPYSCAPQGGIVEGCWYIRFVSDDRRSDEDGLDGYVSALAAAVVIDNIVVTGGLPYTENFEGSTWNSNVQPANSAPDHLTIPSWQGAPWAHVTSGIPTNGGCPDNSGCALTFADPLKVCYLPGPLCFGPGQSVVRNWLDEVIVSPWITLPEMGEGTVLTFRELPANPYSAGRIMRSVSVRGIPEESSCPSPWSNTATQKSTWQELTGFTWVDRVEDLSRVVPGNWDRMQVRFRVADWQYLAGVDPPVTLNTGPGPFIDRVRIGRVALAGPVLSFGEDTRSQAQDCFADRQFMGDIYNTSPFSSSGLGRTPDSIYVAAYDRIRERPLTYVRLYAAIVSGPHAGDAPAPYTAASNGFFSVTAEPCRYPNGGPVIDGKFFVDLADDYFRGGDVIHYYWIARDEAGNTTSLPSGISNPGVVASPGAAEAMTGGLFEVSFLPTISWTVSPAVQTNCVLYVNKTNPDRRSGRVNRTSFMTTLDRVGYAGKYDVYDVQGFGNVDNDLAARASVDQVLGYQMIIHDAGALEVGALSDGRDPELAHIRQDEYYAAWLENAGSSLSRGSMTLWLIGDNIASTTKRAPGVMAKTGIDPNDTAVLPEPGAALANSVVRQQTPFRFWQGQYLTNAVNFPDGFQLAAACPRVAAHDGVQQVLANTGSAAYAITHMLHPAGGDPDYYGVVTMGRTHGLFQDVLGLTVDSYFNTIVMSFAWNSLASPPGLDCQSEGLDCQSKWAIQILGNTIPNCAVVGPTPADTDLGDDQPAVLATQLFPPAPNPVNPSTRITFDLAADAHITLRIFDVAGRRVRTLLDQRQVRGRHVVIWDGCADSGARVASGIYMCQLSLGAQEFLRKVVVVR